MSWLFPRCYVSARRPGREGARGTSDTLRGVASNNPVDDASTSGKAPTAGGVQTAGLGARLLALLVDWLLCLMLARLVSSSPTGGLWVYLILIAEYAFFVGLYTQTPGMWLAKVRCIAIDDLGRIGVARAALRAALMCLVIPVLVMDRYGRGWHDKAVGSIMISAPRSRRSS